MSLQKQVLERLEKLAPFASGNQSLDVLDGADRFRSELVELDRLGCSFIHFAVETPRLEAASVDRLKKVAQTLAERITYLLEPVTAVEVDAERAVVQMRSKPPQKDDDGTVYYELLVERGGSISLCRFKKVTGSARHVAPAHVTREVFARLVGDFCAVLD